MDVEQNKKLVRGYVDELWNRGRLDCAAQFLAPDYRRHMPAGTLDIEGQLRRIAGMRVAFPDLHMAIDDLLAEGDRVALRLRLTGTHRAEFMGVAPSGRAVTMTAVDVVQIVGGRIVEHWGAADMLGLLQQVGGCAR